MSDMADVLAVHQRDHGRRTLHQHCTCGWFGKMGGNDFLPHQAAALSAAGFGPVQEARAEAWDECEAAKYEIRLDPTSRFWEPYKINPYRKASDDGS